MGSESSRVLIIAQIDTNKLRWILIDVCLDEDRCSTLRLFLTSAWFLETSYMDYLKLDTCVFFEPFVEITERAS